MEIKFYFGRTSGWDYALKDKLQQLYLIFKKNGGLVNEHARIENGFCLGPSIQVAIVRSRDATVGRIPSGTRKGTNQYK